MTDRDIEMGPVDPNATSVNTAVLQPGSYVTQMRAAQNPARSNRTPPSERKEVRPPAQQRNALPTHYGMEEEPQCCLCTKVFRIFFFFFVVTVAILIVLYVFWGDIVQKEGMSLGMGIGDEETKTY